MAFVWGPIVAGSYDASYNSIEMGFTIEGYRLGLRYLKQLMDRSDLYGMTMFDGIHQGANATMNYDSRTYSAADLGPVCPFGGLGIIHSIAKPIGGNDRSNAVPFLMTSKANTPAAASPATLTALLTTLSENFNVELLFDSQARKIPVQLNLLPYEHPTVSGTLVHFTTT